MIIIITGLLIISLSIFVLWNDRARNSTKYFLDETLGVLFKKREGK